MNDESRVPRILNYVLVSPRAPIVLNLFEAERYESAVVVQPLIGNLVYYSNRGRYEPKLAESWVRSSPTTWRFKLRDGLACENGEPISAESFRRSVLRSLKYLLQRSELPVFSKLRGYAEFKKGGELQGISVEGRELVFEFDQPIRSGLLQLLSFAPFGYICADNLKPDGSWKDDHKFISSGPFQVESIEVGKRYVLARNPHWALGFSDGAPSSIVITHELPESVASTSFWIVDSFSPVKKLPAAFSEFQLVPEYLNPILLGNIKYGIFREIENRRYFKALVEKHRNDLSETWDGHTRSAAFYPSQEKRPAPLDVVRPKNFGSEKPLTIAGSEPTPTNPRAKAWQVLKNTLIESGLSYKFTDDTASMANLTDQSLDLRMVGGSIGGGVEPWGIGILFCSDLGPKFPDPSGDICKAVARYEKDQINDSEFAKEFFRSVESDAAVIPVSHYGIKLYLAGGINTGTISPLMSVIRFEDLELN